MSGIDEYFSPKLPSQLFGKLKSIRNQRKDEITHLGDIFGDPEELAKFYIEPHCQHANPANEHEEEPSVVS